MYFTVFFFYFICTVYTISFYLFFVSDKRFLSDIGINKEEFHAMTWFSSWAVDSDHSSDNPSMQDVIKPPEIS